MLKVLLRMGLAKELMGTRQQIKNPGYSQGNSEYCRLARK
jgi:hypothetical protein